MRYQEFKLLESRKLLELSDKVKNMIKDRFQKQNPGLTDQQVGYYLDRWDRYAKSFDVQYRDITRLTFDQVEKLIDDAVTKSQLKGKAKTDNTGDTSSEDVVYNKNNLEILRSDLKSKCIRYGQGYSWCISRPDANNMYHRYRVKPDEPSFYFVFDTDRPKTDSWHAVVIYVNNQGTYMVANAKNSGDTQMTWDQIEQAHPKLKGLQGLFKHVPMSDKERSAYERFSKRVNDKTYAQLSLSDKQQYIEVGNVLSPKQQTATPDQLISAYAKSMPTKITSQTYNRIKPGDQRKVMDSMAVAKPGSVVDFAIMVGAERLPPKHEQRILKNAVGAIKYAERVIKGRWPELEVKLLKNSKLIVAYTKRVIGKRWPEGEQQLIKLRQKNQYDTPYLMKDYIISVANERIPEFEQIMVSEKYPKAAIEYARDFLKKRWPELEQALIKSNHTGYTEMYAKSLGMSPEEVGK